MLNMRPGEGFAAGSGPVKLRAVAADPSAGTPFRIPAHADPAAPGTPANGFRPDGNALPPADAAQGTPGNPRNLFPGDARDPAAVSTRQMLDEAAARLRDGAGDIPPGASGPGRFAGTAMVGEAIVGEAIVGQAFVGEAAAAGVEGAVASAGAQLPADLLPDLELEFPAAPLELRAERASLITPLLDGSAATADAAALFGGGIGPGSAGAPHGPLHFALADPSSALPPGARVTEWSGALAAGSARWSALGLQGPPAAEAGADSDSAAGARTAAEALSAGLAARNGQPPGLPATPPPSGANGLAGQAPAPGLQPAPPGIEAMAGLRQAMADLARDGGGSPGDRGRPAAEALTRTDGAGFLSALGLTTASQVSAADRPAFMLPSPPGTPEFADQVAERVVWMAGQKLDRAQIRLNPAHLGPISVDVSVGEDGANITFTAQHAVTREALEQALPRLREMFSGSGLALAGADVSGQGPDTHRGGDDAGAAAGGETPRGAGLSGAADAEAVAETPVRSGPAGRGLIDTYV